MSNFPAHCITKSNITIAKSNHEAIYKRRKDVDLPWVFPIRASHPAPCWRSVPIAVQGWLDAGLDFRTGAELLAEEGRQFVEGRLGVGYEIGKGDFEQLHAVAFF
jgi:hypothetical protein